VIYDLGDAVPLQYEARTPDGTLVAATAVLTVTDPDGNVTTPTVTNPSLGVYDATVITTAVDLWRWKWVISGAVTDVESGEFFVADPAPPTYASLQQLKLHLAGKDATGLVMDTSRDELLLGALQTASRMIEAKCGDRQFWLSSTATARTFNPRYRVRRTQEGELLLVDDIGSTSGLLVEVGSGSSWTTVTSYETLPDNALAKRQAITGLLRIFGLWCYGPAQRVRVTARWGWPAVPEVVERATLMYAARLYRRKDSPEGVLGNAEWGTMRVSRIDPDVETLIGHLILPGFG
jgi:hypothetical protein